MGRKSVRVPCDVKENRPIEKRFFSKTRQIIVINYNISVAEMSCGWADQGSFLLCSREVGCEWPDGCTSAPQGVARAFPIGPSIGKCRSTQMRKSAGVDQLGHAGFAFSRQQAFVKNGKAAAFQRGGDRLAAMLAKAGLQSANGAAAVARECLHVEWCRERRVQIVKGAGDPRGRREGPAFAFQKAVPGGCCLAPRRASG